jgi:hypothetical protein
VLLGDDSFHAFFFHKIEEGLAPVFDITSELDSCAGLQEAFEHAPRLSGAKIKVSLESTFKDRVIRKVPSVIPKEVEDIVKSRRRGLLLKPLQELKTRDSIFIHGGNESFYHVVVSNPAYADRLGKG